VGGAFTVTVAIAELAHPAFVPVTVYEVLEGGFTVMVDTFCPDDHEYAVAPLAVMLTDSPWQTEGEFTEMMGMGLIVTSITSVAIQPAVSVAVNV
jgi:hypothetical protein